MQQVNKLLNLYYHELIGKTEEHEENEYLMVNDYMLDKVLDKIKERRCIEKFGDTKIIIGTDDKLPDYFYFKNVILKVH